MRAGFALPDVYEMTLGQVKIYSQAAERAKRRENRDMLVMLRGAQYERKDFEKLLKAMGD